MPRTTVTATQTTPGAFTLQVGEQTLTLDRKTLKALRTALNAPEVVAAARGTDSNNPCERPSTHLFDALEELLSNSGSPTTKEVFDFIEYSHFGGCLCTWYASYTIYARNRRGLYTHPIAEEFAREYDALAHQRSLEWNTYWHGPRVNGTPINPRPSWLGYKPKPVETNARRHHRQAEHNLTAPIS